MSIDRKAVYEKYHGHCAYCGKTIEFREMQVDHFIPIAKATADNQEKIYSFENLMPSCRRCNHYKRQSDIEVFRTMIESIPSKLMNREYIFKVGVDYGFFNPKDRDVKFYFERIEERHMVHTKCPLGDRGKPTTEFYKDGKPQIYCYGWMDKMTDEPLEECKIFLDYVYGEQIEKDFNAMRVSEE